MYTGEIMPVCIDIVAIEFLESNVIRGITQFSL